MGGLTNLILAFEVKLHNLAFVAFVTNAFGGVGLVGLVEAALVVVVAAVVFGVEVSI